MKRLDHWVLRHLAGIDWCGDRHAGGVNPPGNALRAILTSHQEWHQEWWADITNDGFELMLHSPMSIEPIIMMRSEQARKLAWFVLWRWWICGTWCGVRRAIWYGALRRDCERNSKMAARFSAQAKAS